MTMTTNSFAFFDLDHTLLPVDSSGLWAYFLISKCQGHEQEFERCQKQFDLDYFEGVLDINKFMDFEMHLLSLFPRKQLEQYRKEFIERYIQPNITPNAVELVQKHQDAGDKVVIVTATYRFVVEPIAELFEADGLIAAQPEEDANGEFTGGWIWHTFAQGKVDAVQKYVADKGGMDTLKRSSFYSDSINDLPLLSFIAEHGGTPVAANPDKFLSRIAKQRGWQTLNLFRIEEPSYMEVVEKTP